MAEEKVVGSLWVKLGIDSSELIGGAATAAIQFDALVMAAQIAFDKIEQGFDETVGAAMKYEEAMKHLSEVTGMSIEDAQRWRQTFIDMGVDTNAGTMALTNFTEKLGETGTTGDNLRKRITNLGVSVTDANGNIRDTSAILQDLLPVMGNLSNAHDRDNLALAIFGRNWHDITPLIVDGTKAIKDFQTTSPTFSKADQDSVDEFRIKWGIMSDKLGLFQDEVGLGVIDTLDGIALAGAYAGEEVSALGMGVDGLWEALSKHDGAEIDNAWNRIINPGKYVNDPLSPPQGSTLKDDAAKSNPGTASPGSNTFSDQYAGLNDLQIQLKDAVAEHDKYVAAMKTDTTQEQFDKDAESAQKAANNIATITAEINKVNVAATAAAKSTAALWDSSSVVGDDGSDMQLFLQKEMEAGTSYQDALNNWAQGSPTNTNQAGTLGAVKTASGTTSGTSSSTKAPASLADQAAADTTTITKELTKQLAAYTTLYDGVNKALLENDSLQLDYWKHLTEMQATALDAMAKSDAQFTAFVAENPTIKNIGVVVWTKQGADWDPTKNDQFMQKMRIESVISNIPTIVAPTFAAISTTGGAGTGSSAGTDPTGKTINITANITQNITGGNASGLDIGNAAAKKASQAIASTILEV
jgi:hypothetical protein